VASGLHTISHAIDRQLIAHGHEVLGLTRDPGSRASPGGARRHPGDRRRSRPRRPAPRGQRPPGRRGRPRAHRAQEAAARPPRHGPDQPAAHRGHRLRYGLLYGGDATRTRAMLARRRLTVAKGGVLGWVHQRTPPRPRWPPLSPAFPTYRAGIDAMVSTPAESERSSHADEVPATADGDPGARTAFRRRRRRGAARVLRLGPAGRGVHRRPPPRDRAAVPLLPPWSERPFPFTFVFPVLKGGYFPGLYTAIGHLVLSACCSTCSCGSRRRRPHRHQPRPGECARSGVLRRYGDEPHRSDPSSALGA
jgi:hypothetical protein